MDSLTVGGGECLMAMESESYNTHLNPPLLLYLCMFTLIYIYITAPIVNYFVLFLSFSVSVRHPGMNFHLQVIFSTVPMTELTKIPRILTVHFWLKNVM